MLDTLDNPLTPDLYCSMHDTAVDQVFNKSGDSIAKGYPKGWMETCFVLKDGINCTPEGLEEFKLSPKNGGWIRLVNHLGKQKLVICRTGGDWRMSPQEIAQRCNDHTQRIIYAYDTDIAIAKQIPENDPSRETAILTAVAKCCQDLDQYHFFTDGTIRTAAFLSMNKLLLQMGLSPTILHDPNVLDMYSVEQIVALIRAGQNTFRMLLQ
jgi:hypothetical protein